MTLYEKMTAQADAYAMEIRAFPEKGIPEFVDSYTNQQFVIVTDEQAEKLAKEYTFEQERTLDDGRRVVRFCKAGDHGSGKESVNRRYPEAETKQVDWMIFVPVFRFEEGSYGSAQAGQPRKRRRIS